MSTAQLGCLGGLQPNATPGTNLSLRLWDEADADEAFALVQQSRAHLEHWVEWATQVRCASDLRRLIQHSKQGFSAGRNWQFAIRTSGRIAGGVGLVRRSRYHAELGYWLAAPYCGRGMATFSAQSVLTFGFDTLRLQWVEARCAMSNRRSRALAERLGFVPAMRVGYAQWTATGADDALVYRLNAPPRPANR